MTTEERARRLVGDMPWVTEHLSEAQIVDLGHQIKACLDVAVRDTLQVASDPDEWEKVGNQDDTSAAAYRVGGG